MPQPEPLGPITPIRCSEPSCYWSVHGVPDKYADSRARILVEHQAAEHVPARKVLGTTETPTAPPVADRAPSCRCHSREGLRPEQHENDCPLTTADRADLRDRIAQALDNAHRTHPCPATGSAYWTGCYHPDGTGPSCHTNRRTDAVLAVLLAPTDQATDRRDRYTAAVRAQAETGNVRYEALADAVMPVADAEQADLRAHLTAAGKVLITTSDRLGDTEAELERRTLMLQASRDQVTKLQGGRAAEQAELRAHIAVFRRLADEAQQPTTAEAEGFREWLGRQRVHGTEPTPATTEEPK